MSMEWIDLILYINLDHRGDRRESISNQLNLAGCDMKRVARVPGVLASRPALGCAKAHLQCLERFERELGAETCLILEDDFIFKDIDLAKENLRKVASYGINWDMLLLSGYTLQVESTPFRWLQRAIDVQTTSAYVVHRSFLPTLLQNFRESATMLEKAQGTCHDYCLDQHWKVLMPKYNIFIMNPKLGYQREDYSDIEKRTVHYLDRNDHRTPPPSFKYIVGIMTCRARLYQALNQKKKYFTPDHPDVLHICFIGTPSLRDPWRYDPVHGILELPCPDDYINLCAKVKLFMDACACLFPDVLGVFKTDDDIDVNFKVLVDKLNKFGNKHYWGRVVGVKNGYSSSYLFAKPDVHTVYPLLKTAHVPVPPGNYNAGGGYFISMSAIKALQSESSLFKIHTPMTVSNAKVVNGVIEDFNVFEDVTVGLALRRHNIHPEPRETIRIEECVYWPGI